MIVPNAPSFLLLPIGRLWNGGKCPDFRLSSFVELQKNDKGLLVKTTTSSFPGYKKDQTQKEIEASERICFFIVDDDGQYLEVVLSIDGRFTVSGFDGPNQKVADFNNVAFETNHKEEDNGKILNEIIIPPDLLPSKLSALNVFLVAGGQVLAYHPLPGAEPNLHQPESFPLAKIE